VNSFFDLAADLLGLEEGQPFVAFEPVCCLAVCEGVSVLAVVLTPSKVVNLHFEGSLLHSQYNPVRAYLSIGIFSRTFVLSRGQVLERVKLMVKVKFLLTEWTEYPTIESQQLYHEVEVDAPKSYTRLLAAETDTGSTGMAPVKIWGHRDLSHLVGKLLTYIDATFADQQQRKAHKDILEQTIWDWYNAGSGEAERSMLYSKKLLEDSQS
jgi:hypothetical protein